jgi:MOSC domain-containing protein YiiM
MTNVADTLAIDATRHLDAAALAAAFVTVEAPPTERGTLDHLVVRGEDGSHRVLDAITLSPEDGIHEDRWAAGERREIQVAMMETAVATGFANGQPLALFGDNLFVDLDLSAANTPPGTRIRVGSAVLEVSAKPHTACSTFRERFGVEAARFSGREPERQLRGLFLAVAEAGSATAGDTVEVVSRP